jgi:D-3-phosphoglycerate dehydrogenase|tara:strand:+ start:345 stop:1262 length:918 start_codon:yes stop_codon:yes gene_type:complete
MKIAVITPVKHLEGVVDLLQSKGDVVFYETASKEEVRGLLLQTTIDTLVCNPNQQTYKIDKELLENTSIKTINSCSTGLNHIDLGYCKENNIEIQCHKNDYELINQLPSTSELAFGLMLSLLRNIPKCNNHVSKYHWDYTKFMGRQVKDLKVGIIGYGRLGKMMEKYCKAFGAKTFIYDPYINILQTPLKQIFQECDVISLHVHITDETKYMINKDLFSSIKKDCYIINTSRGEIVNENDIVEGLKLGIITGYGTDVIENEFDNLTKSPIINAMNSGENIIITPHIGGMTIEGQTKAYKHSINKL